MISQQVALVDRQKVNLGVTVFVAVRTRDHDLPWLEKFRATVQAIQEIVEVYRMSGDVDYLLRVVVADLEEYEAFVRKQLHALPGIRSIDTRFAYSVVKNTNVYPNRD